MAQVFRTQKDNPYEIELEGVGRMRGGAVGGIPVERAALRLHELQDEEGQPLTGSKLTTAAKRFADSRGLQIDTVKGDLDEEALRVEGGAFPIGLSIEEISRRASERDRAAVPAAALALDVEPDLPEGDIPPALDQIQPGKEG